MEFSNTISDNSLVSTRSKIFVSSMVAAVFLLSAMVFMDVNFPLTKQKPSARLVEIDLKAGDILAYQVDQHIELQGNEVQKG